MKLTEHQAMFILNHFRKNPHLMYVTLKTGAVVTREECEEILEESLY